MVVGTSEVSLKSSVIEEVTRGVDRSVKGRQEEDGGVCITSDGGVRKSSEVSKVGGRVDGVVEIPREGDNEEGGIEGKPGGREQHWRKMSKENCTSQRRGREPIMEISGCHDSIRPQIMQNIHLI